LQDFSTIDFAIESSSLRAYLTVKSLSQSASADPSNLAELSKAIFVDIKIPAEHTWRGNKYPGELQIVHHWDHTEGRVSCSSKKTNKLLLNAHNNKNLYSS